MNGRTVILGMLLTALIVGASIYYLQIYAYYFDVTAEQAGGVRLTSMVSGQPEVIEVGNFQAIDSNSSPIRFRACFETGLSLATLTGTYQTYGDATPLVTPGWFDCFDAGTVDAGLESGAAIAFVGVKDISYGIDRVVAVFTDGRGYSWDQINACGSVVFNGDPAPAGCPPVPENLQ